MATSLLSLRLASDEFDTSQIQLAEVSGTEALSRLFSFDLKVVCTDPAGLDTQALVGMTASVVFDRASAAETAPLPGSLAPPAEAASAFVAPPRAAAEVTQIHGMIAEVEDMLDFASTHRSYRLRLVPRAYRATMIEAQEVFLDHSIPHIIKAKLARVGLEHDDVVFRLAHEYLPREFVVQYKETDLAFISRLAEHLGISFHFEHESGRDVMVFCDDNALRPPIEGRATVDFQAGASTPDVTRLTTTAKMIPATYVAEDYNYRTPELDLTGRHELDAAYAGGVIDYSPNYLTPAEGARFARLRAEERQATNNVLAGEANVSRFHAGATFVLEGHPRLTDAKLLLVEVEHHASQSVLSHGAAGGDRIYSNTFRAIHAATPYRPPRITPKPRIAGVLSGRIEPHPNGTLGHHAHLDHQGRYTVRFFFDPSPLGERKHSSLRIRMVQPHAGPNYGHHFPLKPGIEVAVAFSEGDPDRPFIMGAVPNPITPSPVTKASYLFNKIQTESGIFIEMKDV